MMIESQMPAPRKAKKAQIVTFEFAVTLIAFIIFVAIAIVIIVFRFPDTPRSDLEVEYVFANLEYNLAQDGYDGVLTSYRAQKSEVERFWLAKQTVSIDNYAIGTINNVPGIGLHVETYDVCWYYTDISGDKIPVNGNIALGQLRSGVSCQQKILANENPCEEYERAISIFQPILWEEGNVDSNRIVQMNLVLCKV
ncbi:MAG TPA: hypothetical protein VK158_01230 [Acidobacteriota bacterium]|nr:hypothetical protein [Acidobacteriota bacterium]